MYRFFRYCELLDFVLSSRSRSDVFTIIASSRTLNSPFTGRWWVDCARHESLLEDSVRDDVPVVVVTALQRSDVAHVSFPLLYMEMIYSDVMGSKVANFSCRLDTVSSSPSVSRLISTSSVSDRWNYSKIFHFRSYTPTPFVIKYL